MPPLPPQVLPGLHHRSPSPRPLLNPRVALGTRTVPPAALTEAHLAAPTARHPVAPTAPLAAPTEARQEALTVHQAATKHSAFRLKYPHAVTHPFTSLLVDIPFVAHTH